MSKRRQISPTAAAVLLATLVGGLGTTPGAGIPKADSSRIQAQTPQNSGTRSTPTNSQSQTGRVQAEAGSGRGRSRRRWNHNRQVRRLLEQNGIITSGRQWVRFRKRARKYAVEMHIMTLALQMVTGRRG